jgi:hypothetical protein
MPELSTPLELVHPAQPLGEPRSQATPVPRCGKGPQELNLGKKLVEPIERILPRLQLSGLEVAPPRATIRNPFNYTSTNGMRRPTLGLRNGGCGSRVGIPQRHQVGRLGHHYSHQSDRLLQGTPSGKIDQHARGADQVSSIDAKMLTLEQVLDGTRLATVLLVLLANLANHTTIIPGGLSVV